MGPLKSNPDKYSSSQDIATSNPKFIDYFINIPISNIYSQTKPLQFPSQEQKDEQVITLCRMVF